MYTLSKALSILAVFSTALAHPGLNKRDVPIGQVITKCTVPGQVAVTFDDGPFDYTEEVLDLFKGTGHRATFFMNGQNYGNGIKAYANAVKRMVSEGHQLGSHTWSHAHLIDPATDVQQEMLKLESALKDIVGFFPTYMRPPYLETNDYSLGILRDLGYHVISIDIDTKDYENQSPDAIGVALNNFKNGINAQGSISLSHDTLKYTAENLVPGILQALNDKGLKSVTVGQCLGDSIANWYKAKRDSIPTVPPPPTTTNPPAPGVTLSPDGSCGPNNGKGYTCTPGNCCSQYGYCGASNDFCGFGCQPGFGICN